MTTRAQQKELTRLALIQAALELFSEQGLDGPSLDTICERAGRTRGAFYVHFSDREALMVAVMDRILHGYLDLIVVTQDRAGDLVRTIDHFIELASAPRSARPTLRAMGTHHLRLLLQATHRSAEVRARFDALVQLGQEQLTHAIVAAQGGGTARADLPAAALAQLVVHQVFGSLALLETGASVDVRSASLALKAAFAPPSPAPQSAAAWITRLALRPHPEGGYFRESYRAAEGLPARALPVRFAGPRAFGTAIYYLLKQGQLSTFHRIHSDEVWHAYAGQELWVHELTPEGAYTRWRVGCGPEASPQVVIQAGSWFAAELAPGGSYALVGCTVAPGFDFADFEMAEAEALAATYPGHEALIRRLTAN